MIYLNGEILPSEKAQIHVSDLGLLRGYGIFDFFRAIDGQPIFIEDHLDRFENSARLMRLPIPESRERLREIILEIIRLNPHPLLGVKMVMTGGYSEDGYTPSEQSNLIVMGKPFEFKPADIGMKLMSMEYRREIPEIKTLNYIVPIRAIQQMKAQGADDLLYYRDGKISESSRSNIFIIKNEKIITPVDGALFGVTRKHILNFAKKHFIVEERDVTVQEFWEADEVFTTGSTKRIVAITKTDNQVFSDGKVGRITKKLQELFLEEEKANEKITL
ncbi:D-alanine transaminase/branched-chain amino acid aminotransferase [Arcicella aurantiaca]|uniref:branched-chain-amino-acid transaminase n=1 Tax=Arcicella aurantiaca TaxID=591202 RepID=A0A316EG03_9BACT|nr:aminotransferase class IV [Arcicella aurantiaca]PWK28349.1 D-alanine transaminase/branched-chain amino acid aminotransferase [Arcicella aurantiaca]